MPVTRTIGGSVYPYETSVDQSETTLTAHVGVDFDRVGGDGAHGISITFGTSR